MNVFKIAKIRTRKLSVSAYLLCFRLSVKLSAIIAMNSLLVGFPLIFDTV